MVRSLPKLPFLIINAKNQNAASLLGILEPAENHEKGVPVCGPMEHSFEVLIRN